MDKDSGMAWEGTDDCNDLGTHIPLCEYSLENVSVTSSVSTTPGKSLCVTGIYSFCDTST